MHTIANKEAPIYLQKLLQHVNETVTRSNLHSSDSNTFIKPRTRIPGPPSAKWQNFVTMLFCRTNVFFRWTSSLECTASWTKIHQVQRHFQATSQDPLFYTYILTLLAHSLHFRFRCFIACLIRCTVLLDISVYWRTTNALLLLLFRQVLHTHVPLSSSSIICYRSKNCKVTAD